MEAVLRNASEIYSVAYFGIIMVVALLEYVVPRREAGDILRLRWAGNIGITILDTIVLRLLFPLVGFGWAIYCSERGWGFFNQVALPRWMAFFLAIVLLDAGYYIQHRLLHRIPLLWRLHRTHHSDQDYDFTTGVRFHPLETVVTTVFILGMILALGAPPIAVFASQLLTLAISLEQHANVRIPARLDRALRLFLVTPDMHRIHHSQDIRDTESNFGSTLPLWDRLFHTYADQPVAGHERIAFGLVEFGARKHLTLPWMLAQPFLRAEDPETVSSSITDAPDHAGEPAAYNRTVERV